MKKFIAIILTLLFTLNLFACKTNEGLAPYVSELRSNVFTGESGDLTVKGAYGFKETPYQNDGKVGTKVYLLTLKILGKETSQTSYTATLDFNDFKYTAEFKLSPVSHSLIATIEVENFNLNEFILNIAYGDKTEAITMRSEIPNGTLSYSDALNQLEKSQPELIKAFSDSEGTFCAEIYARIIVKNSKAYWYIGFARGNDLLKALLINGKTGEVLTVREIL